MDCTACTEPQCLYSRAIPLLPLWAVRPVQSLSACTRAHLTFNVPQNLNFLTVVARMKDSRVHYNCRIVVLSILFVKTRK